MQLSLVRRTFIGLAGIWVCLLPDISTTFAQAQTDYPNKPIRIIVGFTAGGSTDIVARLVAAKMQASWGQPVIVENKPGAGGAIAADFVAKSPADGYIILLPPSGHSSSAAMRKTLPYDPISDFSWISTITTYGMMFAVRPESPIQSVEDLIKAAKANPSKLSYYSVGVGTGHHLIGEWLNAAAGIEINHVPYRGSAAALPDFMGGQVDVMIDTMTFALTQAQTGKAKPLAVTSRKRLAELPNVPVMSEKCLTSSMSPGLVWPGPRASLQTSSRKSTPRLRRSYRCRTSRHASRISAPFRSPVLPTNSRNWFPRISKPSARSSSCEISRRNNLNRPR